MVETRLKAALWLLAVAVGFSGTARAGLIVCDDAAGFQAATADLAMTTIEFEGIAPERGVQEFDARGGLELSGVTFSTSSSAVLAVAGSRYWLDRSLTWDEPYYNFGSGAFLQVEEGSPASLNIALPEGIVAAGFFLGTFDTVSSGVTIELSTGESFVVSAPYPTTTFVGVVSSAPLSWINLTISEGDIRSTLTVDSFTFGAAQTQAIPEPGSLTLLALGGAGALAFLARRRQAG